MHDVLYFTVYTRIEREIETTDDNLGLSGSVISTLLVPYLNKGHNLFCDNWHTSTQLFHFLHENGTDACGTVCPQRVGIPKYLPNKMSKEGHRYVISNNIFL